MKKLHVLLLAALLVVTSLALGIGPVAAGQDSRKVDAATGATPNYRTFLESDLKSMQNVTEDPANPGKYLTGGLEGGDYTCLKAQPPYTFFNQEWYGVSLEYLLDVEVGLKPGTTGIKVWASDDFNVTLTLDELRMKNPDGLRTILAWKKGAEQGTGGNALAELDNQEGPFRLIIPQEVIGSHGVGTDNFNRSVRQVRAIEVQPVQVGLPPVVPKSIPDGRIAVFGNILSRRAFTVDQLKSIDPVADTYSWKNSVGTKGTSDCTGILLPKLLDEVVGVLPTATGVKAWSSDNFGRNWTLDEMRDTYLDDTRFMVAWNVDGVDLTPEWPATAEPGNDVGPLRLIKPQADLEEGNLSRWAKNLRALQLYTTANPNDDPLGINLRMVPNDRLIVCGAVNPKNVPSVWYLAEGYTGTGFQEWITIQNPNPWRTKVVVDFMLKGEAPKNMELNVDAMSRTNINVAAQVGENKDVSARVEGYHGDSIVVERAMYWNGRQGGHASAGITAPGQSWYLAEGSTAGGFETWVTLQNPQDAEANVELTYMTPDGEVAGPKVKVPAKARETVNVADKVPDNWSVSTKVTSDKDIVAERAVYWNGRQGGHCAGAVAEPGLEWYMAEGSTADGFETWITLQNPGTKDAEVQLSFMTAAGTVPGPKVPVKAGSRKTVEVAKTLANNAMVSTRAVSDEPIIAERAMYWSGRGGGHCNSAASEPQFRSMLAEGSTGGGFQTWIVLQNPGQSDATVYVTYLTGKGAIEREPVVVKAGQRTNIEVAKDLPDNDMVSASLSSTAPVTVERAVYWDAMTEGSCASGYQSW